MALLIILGILADICIITYLGKRMLIHLQMLQQNSYRAERYLPWLKERRSMYMLKRDFAPLLAYIVIFIIEVLLYGFDIATSLEIMALTISSVTIIGFIILLLTFKKPVQKKPLVFTKRASRLYFLTMALICGVLIVPQFITIYPHLIFACLMAYFAPYILVFALNIAKPIEKHINDGFINDAKNILDSMPNLKKIAVTGSYGKTSCKMAISSILNENFTTLVTPHSYNTPMGITITVRTMLKPIHQIFVSEMGAKNIGDIKELCDIVKPEIGIVTAIGPQHLETFKTIENVAATKFELIDALPETGMAILNFDDDIIRVKSIGVKARVVSFGINSLDADFRAENITFSPKGMSFEVITPDGERTQMTTNLLGKHNIYNILAATALAYNLGMNMKKISRGISKLPQVQYRLELTRRRDGVTVINDAFNSNPAGAAAALEVMAAMPATGTKYIITPGMIELGEKQAEENRKFAINAAASCDYIVLVGVKITKAMQEGLQSIDYPQDKYYVAKDLNDANRHVNAKLKSGDYIIYENDLPDSYNE